MCVGACVWQAVLAAWRDAATRHGLLLDLVYGAIAWGTLAEHGFAPTPSSAPAADAAADATLYVHCGGVEGLGSSLRRYERAGLLRPGERAEDALAEAARAAGVDASVD